MLTIILFIIGGLILTGCLIYAMFAVFGTTATLIVVGIFLIIISIFYWRNW
jgi:hypothetical protein